MLKVSCNTTHTIESPNWKKRTFCNLTHSLINKTATKWRRNWYKTQVNHTLEVIQVYFNKDSNLLLLLEDQ